MNQDLKKTLLTIATLALALGTGIFGFLMGVNYGGNNGCFEFAGMSGYESCGMFGGIIGILLGLLVGLFLLKAFTEE
jgi:hypothetical protein